MGRLFRRSEELTAGVCERCARFCDGACRRAALPERVLLQQLWLGVRT